VVYVLDGVRGVIESYDQDGNVLDSIDDDRSSPAGFNTACSLSLDRQGNFYVSDCCSAGNQVQELDPTGTLLQTFGATGTGQFTDGPGGMAIDGAGRLFVGQGPTGPSDKVEIFAADGSFLASFGAPGSGDGQFTMTYGIALDGAGDVYVTDAATNRVEKFRLLAPFAP
jgi:tripartite motif-containing protein 71